MLQTLRKMILTVGASLSLVFIPVLAPVAVHAADIGGKLGCGSNLEVDIDSCSAGEAEGTSRIQGIVTAVVNIFSVVVGLVAVIMIIVGGFKYITSGGDSGNITSAKNTIVYAVIGLVVVALAQFIVKFVLEKVNTSTTL